MGVLHMGISENGWVDVIWRNHFDSPENIGNLNAVVCGKKWGQFLYPFCTALITIRIFKNI